MTFVYRSLALLPLLMLVGCVTSVRTDVSRFQAPSLPNDLTGKTFVFVPLDSQKGSVEYETHAAAIASYLEKYGWRRTSDLRNADYGIAFSYGQGDARTTTMQVPIYGQTGGGTSYTSGTASTYGVGGTRYGSYSGSTYTPPTYGVVGSTTQTNTSYTRFLDANIYDWKTSIADTKLAGVWEARATSVGSSSSFAAVSKCMIRAVFGEFRKAGTEKVETPVAQCE
jgi:hypothetical protein